MATWTRDPTFYPSPRMAMQAPAEKLGYVAILNVARNKPNALMEPEVSRPIGSHYV
jgi:methanethiol oxidase